MENLDVRKEMNNKQKSARNCASSSRLKHHPVFVVLLFFTSMGISNAAESENPNDHASREELTGTFNLYTNSTRSKRQLFREDIPTHRPLSGNVYALYYGFPLPSRFNDHSSKSIGYGGYLRRPTGPPEHFGGPAPPPPNGPPRPPLHGPPRPPVFRFPVTVSQVHDYEPPQKPRPHSPHAGPPSRHVHHHFHYKPHPPPYVQNQIHHHQKGPHGVKYDQHHYNSPQPGFSYGKGPYVESDSGPYAPPHYVTYQLSPAYLPSSKPSIEIVPVVPHGRHHPKRPNPPKFQHQPRYLGGFLPSYGVPTKHTALAIPLVLAAHYQDAHGPLKRSVDKDETKL